MKDLRKIIINKLRDLDALRDSYLDKAVTAKTNKLNAEYIDLANSIVAQMDILEEILEENDQA